MSYYVRAFCKSSTVPELLSIQNWLRNRKCSAVIDEPDHAVASARSGEPLRSSIKLETHEWDQIALAYMPGKLPILVSCERVNNSTDCLARTEIAEFIDLVQRARWSFGKSRIMRHLTASKYIVSCQFPVSDFADEGYDANGELLQYFVRHHGGLIHAEGEGFYSDGRIILAAG